MKIIKICLLLISLAFIGDLFPAAAAGAGMNNALKSFVDSEDENYIPAGEAGFKKVLDLIHSPEYKKQKANGPVRNRIGRTLLSLAISGQRVDIVRMLLDNDESIYAVEGNANALQLARGFLNNFESHYDTGHEVEDSDDETYEVIQAKIKKIKTIIAFIEAKEKQIQDNLRLVANTRVALEAALNDSIPVNALRNAIFEYLF